MSNKILVLTIASLCWISSCVAPLPKGLEAHPQGLLPSQDTSTTPGGFLEVEAISSWGETEQATSVAMRYGLAERTELYLLQELHHAINTPGLAKASGVGDAWLGMRHRIIDSDASGTAHAFAAEVRLPHGDPSTGLGTGQLELHLIHIRDTSWRRYDVTTNTGVKLIGDGEDRPDPALTASVTLTDPLISVGGKQLPFGVIAEAGGSWQPEANSYPAWVALGLRVPIHPSLELQIARIEGLGRDGPEPAWIVDLGRLVGDALDLRSR
jgi:hypothetical protein